MVTGGECMVDCHFRLRARAIPDDDNPPQILAAMEGRQARDFAGWGANLGVHPDAPVARNLFATLHALWLGASRFGDRLARLKPDLAKRIGIAPVDLVGNFMACFQESLVAMGFGPARCRQGLTELAAAALA